MLGPEVLEAARVAGRDPFRHEVLEITETLQRFTSTARLEQAVSGSPGLARSGNTGNGDVNVVMWSWC